MTKLSFIGVALLLAACSCGPKKAKYTVPPGFKLVHCGSPKVPDYDAIIPERFKGSYAPDTGRYTGNFSSAKHDMLVLFVVRADDPINALAYEKGFDRAKGTHCPEITGNGFIGYLEVTRRDVDVDPKYLSSLWAIAHMKKGNYRMAVQFQYSEPFPLAEEKTILDEIKTVATTIDPGD